ncbi:MAG: ABC transporter permease [Marinilabiliales bacterium]
MSKTGQVIKREYITRVRKKSFIIMSIIGPVLFAVLMTIPAILANLDDRQEKLIAVIDDTYLFNDSIPKRELIPDSLIKDSSHIFVNVLPNTDYIKFKFIEDKSLEELKREFEDSPYYAILHIPYNLPYGQRVQLFSKEQPSLSTQMHIANSIEKELERLELQTKGISQKILRSVNVNIKVSTIKIKDGKETETNTDLATFVGMLSGILIYMFIFMYGAQVMRGVIEEKTNRIVEIIVSSVRPFKLMLGKIIGIGLVSLTQIILWVVFTFIIVTSIYTVFFTENMKVENIKPENIMTSSVAGQDEIINEINIDEWVNDAWKQINQIDFYVMILSFIFYFLGGYFLYSSLFAAVGAAVDNETDTQQFMLPITVPLIIGFFMMYTIFNNPEGPIAFWGSMIPFTSPIVMMARIPFGVPIHEIIISAILLILTFLGTTWLSGKIYRTGILMYGKKVTYKDLWKWIKYKS